MIFLVLGRSLLKIFTFTAVSEKAEKLKYETKLEKLKPLSFTNPLFCKCKNIMKKIHQGKLISNFQL